MAKLSNEEKSKIIQRDMPGYKLVDRSEQSESANKFSNADSTSAKPEATTPGLKDLRRKYFGEDASEEASDSHTSSKNSNPGTDNSDSDEDEMATVVPENSRDAFDRGGRAKSVIISGGKIKGSQG